MEFKSTALVTGASSGIGAVYADRLAHRGYDVVLVARNEDRLHDLATRLAAETGRGADILVADLGRHDDVSRVAELLKSREDITVLVNNAGVGAVSALVDSDVAAMEQMIGVNVLAFTQSLQHELSGSGVRAQAVLPNATATPFWGSTGRPLADPAAFMSAADLVDAALIDLDRGELISIPPLQDQAQWDSYASARAVLTANFGANRPAPRYAGT